MTLEDLFKLPHLTTTEKAEKWIHLHTEEGYYLTTYTEDKEIEEFDGYNCIYAPIQEEYPEYHIIDAEMYQKLYDEREIAIEKKNEENRMKYSNGK